MNLIKQTKQLIEECDASTNRFFKMRELDATPLFFEEVKPHADQIQAMLNDWQQAANSWIRQNQPKYIHEIQIANAVEAMNQFVVQSFYKETSKKRIIQSIQSVHYTLSNFLRVLEEGDNDAVK
ncbi:MAG TPA: YppE family protein [Ureibacillus sp.]|nr:YppE family protein [Ureibacillus sp.]